MELSKKELDCIQSTIADSLDLKELNEIQLALIGGGSGEMIAG